MEVVNGQVIFGGIAIGNIFIIGKKDNHIVRKRISDTNAELLRFQTAIEQVKQQFDYLYDKACRELGEGHAMLLEEHRMISEDSEYEEIIMRMITSQEMNAEYAVATAGEYFTDMLLSEEDEALKSRAAGIRDVTNRIVAILQGDSGDILTSEEPVIVVADELAVSDAIQFDKSKVLAFVIRHGSADSPAAIYARAISIPTLVGVEYSDDMNGKQAVVDGDNGLFYVEPEESVENEFRILMGHSN